MSALYEINALIKNFEFEIDEETGEILNIAELDGLNLEREEKIENIGLYIKNTKSDLEAYKKEEEVFKKKREAAQKRLDNLKNYLRICLDGEKFKTSKVNIYYSKSEAVVTPEDVYSIPDDYLKYSAPTPDKTKIKEAIKKGEYVSGCSLEEHTNIVIR